MILVKYIDVYDSYYDDDGNICNDLLHENHTVPFDINESEILTISPYFGKNGKLFKQVSIVSDRYGSSYKVVGNYKDIKKRKENKPNIGTIGYGITNKI